MPTLRDVLRRWRPAGTPGAAGRSGVPDDRAPAPERELATVFQTLEPVLAECRTIRDTAARDVDVMAARARELAEAVLAEARAKAVTEHAKAAAEAQAHSDAEQAAIIAEAERRAARIRERASERTPALIAEAVELVRKELR